MVGQTGAAAAFGLGEQVQRSRARTRVSAGGDAAGPSDPVGNGEPDAEHARQLVGLLADHPVGGRAVLGVHALDQVAKSVRGEQQVQLARHAHPVPGRRGLGGPPGAQPDRGKRRLGIAVDRLDHRTGAVALDQQGRPFEADVLDPAQVGDQRVGVGRRKRPRLGHLDLQPVPAVIDPGADHSGPLALLEMDQRADEYH